MPTYQILGYMISIIALTAYYKIFCSSATQPTYKKVSFILTGTTLVILFSYGVLTRVILINSITRGYYIFEEIGASVVYISKLLNGEKTYSGATQIVYAILLDWWRTLGGFSVFWARALSGLIGIIGLPFYYLGVTKFASKNAALMTTALLASSIYATFFSKLAIETGWVLTIFGINFYIFCLIFYDRLTLSRCFFLGLSLAIGVFTYPGYSVGLSALIASSLITALCNRKLIYSTYTLHKSKFIYLFLAGFVGVLLITLPALYVHFKYQAHATLFLGGGVFSHSEVSYLTSLSAQLTDIFIGCRSYYLPFQDTGFVEASLWGFFLIGIQQHVFKQRNPILLMLLGMIFVLPFFVALAKNYPGMRRGVLFLSPFYIFAGLGLSQFLALLSQQKYLYTKALGTFAVCASLLFIGFIQYETTVGSANTRSYTQLNEILLHHDFPDTLEKADVILLIDGLNEFDVDYIKSALFLINRYEPRHFDLRTSLRLSGIGGALNLNPNRNSNIITNKLKNLSQYTNSSDFCLTNTRKIETKDYPLFAAEAWKKTSYHCKF